MIIQPRYYVKQSDSDFNENQKNRKYNEFDAKITKKDSGKSSDLSHLSFRQKLVKFFKKK